MSEKLFLEEARLGPRNQVLLEHDEVPQLRRAKARYPHYLLVDLAHTVMLVERGILTPERGGRILGALLEAEALGAEGFPWDPRVGSYLVQIEHFLGARIGEDLAGRMHTGRSRNDHSAAADRIFFRDALLAVATEAIALARAVTGLARAHTRTLMPGYTHLQHAQPITFGHHLMRIASALLRDLGRIRDSFERTNLGVLGGAAMAGTSWPVDRRRTAELLGHDGVVLNASDAGVFARDYVEENTATLALVMSGLGRFATDLYLWHSWEFSFLEVDDGLAGTSSIMPQKKNPHALERIKGSAGQAVGWLPAVMGAQRSAMSTDLDLVYSDDIFTPMVADVVGALRLMSEVVRTLTVHSARMAEAAAGSWSTTSHLADELVRRYDLPFRTAHQIVGRFVRDSLRAGHGPAHVSASLLEAAAREVAKVEVTIETAELRAILDPWSFVQSRTSEGGVNPARVDEHIALMDAELNAHEAWLDEKRGHVHRSLEELHTRARELEGRA